MIKPFRNNYVLTQGFGGNKDSYIQFGILGHNGLDYGTPTGTQIIAPHSGKVIEVADEGTRGYGKYIKIENDKEGSVLAHLSSFQVKVGDSVSEGQPIALSGNTGNSTGPHLHWGYYLFPRNRQNGYAGFIDQYPLISEPVKPPLLLDPNPGYMPTHHPMTVEQDNKVYESYKDSTGKLLWKVRPSTPPEKPITDDTIIPQIESRAVKDIKKELEDLRADNKNKNNAVGKLVVEKEALEIRIKKMKDFVKSA